jgi:hypothetical protein
MAVSSSVPSCSLHAETSVIVFIADPLLPSMYPDAALGMSSFISNPEVVDEEKKEEEIREVKRRGEKGRELLEIVILSMMRTHIMIRL